MSKAPPRVDPATGLRLTRSGMPVTPRKQPPKVKKTISIRALIEGALDELGGQKWLVKQMDRYPQKAMELIARVMPHQIQTEHHEFTYVIQKITMDTGPVPGVIRDGSQDVELIQ